MKKKNKNGFRREYDLSHLKGEVRGKYAVRYRSGTNLVHLDPDVARIFENEKSVNAALRSLIKLAKNQLAHSH